MTLRGTYILTAVSAAIFILLCWIFADGLFTENWWSRDDIATSAIWTYVLLALIVGSGLVQARRLPDEGVQILPSSTETTGQVDDPSLWKLLMGNVYFAIFWLPIRFFVGREWLSAGEHKLRDSAWMDTGEALQGYWQSAVAVPEPPGRPRITYDWFRELLQYMLDHEWYTWFAKVVAIGEFLIGLGLVVGALVGMAAFFGTFMNFNFLLAGTASTNPVLFGLGVFLVLAWKVAGFWGLDRWLLPAFGAPWSPGRVFMRESDRSPSGSDLRAPGI
jgi:thiosulfate dehydrogenase [quinone] large subunit